jgi:hypothetical protein
VIRHYYIYRVRRFFRYLGYRMELSYIVRSLILRLRVKRMAEKYRVYRFLHIWPVTVRMWSKLRRMSKVYYVVCIRWRFHEARQEQLRLRWYRVAMLLDEWITRRNIV